MGNYANALLNNQILTAAQMDMLWMPQELDDGTLINPPGGSLDLQGLSWFWDGDKVHHGGAQQKARSQLTIWPDGGLAVAVMTNAGHSVGVRQLSYDIGQLVLDRVADGDAPIKDARYYMTAVSRLVYQTAPYLRAVAP